MPAVFMVHVTLLFSAFLNVAFLLLVRLLPGKAHRADDDLSAHRRVGRRSGVYIRT